MVNSVVLAGFLFVLFLLVFDCLCALCSLMVFFGFGTLNMVCDCCRFVVDLVYGNFFVKVFVACLCCLLMFTFFTDLTCCGFVLIVLLWAYESDCLVRGFCDLYISW